MPRPPRYHLSKPHWNAVRPDGSVPEDELLDLINHSHELVVARLSRAEPEQAAHLPVTCGETRPAKTARPRRTTNSGPAQATMPRISTAHIPAGLRAIDLRL